MRSVIFIAILAFFMVGCSSLLNRNEGVIGKASQAEDKAKSQIELVDTSAAKVNVQRLDKIGALSSGVAYSLSKDTNDSPAVITAKTLNERVMALANKPDFKEAQQVAILVDELITNQAEGKKMLAQKDKEIEGLEQNMKQLSDDKEKALQQYYSLADKTAAQTDQYKATLGQMDSWFGLGAVWYGVHRLFVSAFWFFVIGGIIFIILRLLAASNPIASSIFMVFEQMVSWVINTLAALAPRALSIAGHISTSIYTEAKGGLSRIVDSVETVKLQQQATGKEATIQDLLNTAEASMTPADKALIEKIKVELGWVKPSTTPTSPTIAAATSTKASVK